jgi:hypothetical protein
MSPGDERVWNGTSGAQDSFQAGNRSLKIIITKQISYT